jgi:chromosome condensin MukBEF ATPase and DNA-binding subunit MukB
MLSNLLGWKGYAAAGGVCLVLGTFAGHKVEAWRQDARYNALVASNAKVMQDYSDRASKAETAQREEVERRQDEKDKIQNEAKDRIATAQADAARAASERDRLRSQLAVFTARHRGAGQDTAAGTGSPPAGDALDLLANLFSESDDTAGILAAALDGSRDAGLTCERQYDSLTGTKAP